MLRRDPCDDRRDEALAVQFDRKDHITKDELDRAFNLILRHLHIIVPTDRHCGDVANIPNNRFRRRKQFISYLSVRNDYSADLLHNPNLFLHIPMID